MSPSRRAALISLAAAIFLVVVKLVVGLATGSLGVVAEAVHSAADSFAALLTLYAVTVAERPADRIHQYGHGKAQNLGALAETLLLVGAAGWIAVVAIGRFSGGATGPHSVGIGIGLMLFVLVVDASRALIARRTAAAEHSAALYASSWHFATDFAGSLAVLIGLVLASFGHPNGDAIAALVVAGIIMIVAITLAVRNVESLMDRAPHGLDQRITEAALTVAGVDEVRSVRVRESGGEVFADVVIGVPRLRGIELSHEITDAVEHAIEHAVEQTSGRTSVTVHVEPTDVGERAAERVAAAALRVPGVMEVHNIAVLADGPRREVTLHARVAEQETLGGVEDTLARLRTEIARDLSVGDVHIHLEPFAPEAQEAKEVTGDEAALVALATAAAVRAAHAPCLVELWRQDSRLVAVCALEADPAISVRAAHVLAGDVEDAVREAVPVLADVIVEVSARTAAERVIVERAPATELIPRPLELLDAAVKQGRPLGVWSRATEAALVLGSGQHPPADWSPPDGLPLARRGTGGGAVLCDEDYLMLDIALPAGDRRILDDVTETYRWLAERLVAALGRLGVDDLSLVDPLALRKLDAPAREAARLACFAGLGPYELLDAHGGKLVGLAQRRRRGGVLLQAAAYLGGDRGELADVLWIPAGERAGLRARLRASATLGPVGLHLPEELGPVWK